MALDHDPEHTISVFRYGRTGDRFKRNRPRLLRVPIASAVFDLLGISLEYQAGKYRVPIACPHCGAVTLSRDDTYALIFRGGGVHDETGVNSKPDWIACLACNGSVNALDLLADWTAKDLDALLAGNGPFRRYAEKPEDFIVGKVGNKFPIGRTVKEALDKELPPVFEMTQPLTRIRAMGPDHARALVDQHHGAMTWRDVQITQDLEPVDVGWHGGPLAPWEQAMLKRRRKDAKTQARKDLDADCAAYRNKRAAELGVQC